jgi:ATP-binding cassette subfamily B protein RaxB
MISNAFGYRVDLSDLRRRFSISLKGCTLATVIRHAESIGLSGRPLRLELDELAELKTPCILHWNMNHFVVLEKANKREITILNPAVGIQKLLLSEASRHFTGIALELSPTPSFRKADERQRLHLGDLAAKTAGLRPALLQVFLLAIALEIFALVAPLFNQLVIDEVVVTSDRELLSVLAVGFGLLLLIQTTIGLLRSWIIMRVSMDVRLQWTGGLFSHLVRLPAAFFEKRHLGDIVSRFSSITTIQNTLTTSIITAILDGLMAIMALGMMLFYSPILTLIVVAAVLLYGLLRWAFYSSFREANAERLVLSAKENTHFLETLRAIVPVKLAGHETERRTRWQHLLTDVMDRDLRTQKLGLVFSTSSTLITGASTLLLLSHGAQQVMDNTLSIGMLMAFNSYAGTFSGRVNALIGYAVDLKMLGLHAERLADIALEPSEQQAMVETDVQRLKGKIEVRNVSFRYAEGEPWILQHFDLTVAPGESVAIVGPSGCGKSTLLKIILGLLEPTEGEILIDGIPIHRLGLPSYRQLIGAVTQDDTLLAGSITENISFFDPNANQECIEASTKIAAIHEEILAMPMGYQTMVGDMGSSLSGGQKQRALLARALYKHPKVLILDEATSHLDAFNEHRVVNALRPLGITRIQVAHRRETIANAERIVVLGGHETVTSCTQAEYPSDHSTQVAI